MVSAIGEQGAIIFRCAAPEHRAHARGEFAEAERLGDVVIGAKLEPGHAIVFGGPRRQHDDGHVTRIRSRSQNAAHFHAADDGQIEIENDEVGRFLGDRLQRGVAAVDDVGFGVAGPFERMFDESRDVLLVFDDQYPVSGHASVTVRVARFRAVSELLIVG